MVPTSQAIFVDLDNSIFRTRSMKPELFEPFFKDLITGLKTVYDQATIEKIINELWEKTFLEVIQKYKIDPDKFLASLALLNELTSGLDIQTYDDYHFLKKLAAPKFLVTTGPTSFQSLKISSLGIENDFEKIVINDTFKETRNKQDIFLELANALQLKPEQIFVIGDNSDAEIAAGNALGMVTIQILRPGVTKGNNARHFIHSFEEIERIMATGI